jgi:CRISPR-associated protein Cas2
VQNSAFEGELTEAQLERIKAELSDLIDPDYDSVYIYRLPEKRWVTKEILGQAKTVVDALLE